MFGDQTTDCRSFLKKAVAREDNVLLGLFLEKAAFAIRDENAQRPHVDHDVPDFTTIQELADRYLAKGEVDPAFESALVCLSQLVHFIG